MGRTLRVHHSHLLISFVFIVLVLLLQSFVSADSEPTMRVGLATVGKQRSIAIRADKPFSIRNSAGDEVTLVDGKDAIFSSSDGISITIDGVSLDPCPGPLRLVAPDSTTTFEIVSPKLRYGKYRGVLEINGGKSLSVVNELTIEDYVRGVLPMEVPASFQPEAQKALTIAIRTYALTSIGRHKSDGFDVCDTTNCQGFSGVSRDADWVDKLIDDTQGQVLTYDGKLIHALYSSDCGGATQSNEDAGFGKDPWPYLRSVSDHQESGAGSQKPEELPTPNAQLPTSNAQQPDPQSDYCSGCPNHAWSKTYSADELAKAFGRTKIGALQSVEFAEYDSSGRVKTVVVKGDKGEYRTTGSKFRAMFGETVMKSTRMTLSVSDDGKYTINGQGYGHGVGLCAWGANGMAKAGVHCADILKHYYTGAEVKTISDLGFRISD